MFPLKECNSAEAKIGQLMINQRSGHVEPYCKTVLNSW